MSPLVRRHVPELSPIRTRNTPMPGHILQRDLPLDVDRRVDGIGSVGEHSDPALPHPR